MSSSTSSSDASAAARGGVWRAFVRTALAVAAGTLGLFLLAAIVLDPYDTGRTPLDLRDGVRPQGPRTAAASRGRDPAYAGAIFGNSHIQLVSPANLAEATGIPFVSLIAPATGPKEAFVLMEWWLARRPRPAQAVVIGLDPRWCVADPALPNEKPFPFWLFSANPLDYAAGLIRFDVVEEVQRRLAWLLRREPPRARPDGYWDYEEGYIVQGFETDPERRAKLAEPMSFGGGNVVGPFPAAERLEALLARAAPQVPVVLVRPPNYVTALPVPGSPDAAADAACRAAFAGLAARRPLTALVDWRVDRPENRDPNRFFDHTHYRQPIARLLEADIAAALAALRR